LLKKGLQIPVHTSTTTLAQKDNHFVGFHVIHQKISSWIVDFGTSYHMAEDIHVFRKDTHCHNNFIVDRTTSKVVGKGFVIISDITLESVLCP